DGARRRSRIDSQAGLLGQCTLSKHAETSDTPEELQQICRPSTPNASPYQGQRRVVEAGSALFTGARTSPRQIGHSLFLLINRKTRFTTIESAPTAATR